jgi:hypothetical protein
VNGIASLATGSPRSISSNDVLTHPLMLGNSVTRPDMLPGASNNPVLGGPNRYFDPSLFVVQRRGFYGNLGRNTLITPGLAQVDLSLIKGFTVREGQRIEFRSEFFNVFNRANFGYPSTGLFNSSGARLAAAGRITSTSTTARQVQFALKYTF